MSSTPKASKLQSFPWGLAFIGLVCMVFMVADMSNGRFQLYDFEVYYKAANRILQAQNLYQIPEDGHYIFKYSPTSAIYFLPYSILPFAVARCVYWLSLSALIVMGFKIYTQISTRTLIETYSHKALNTIVFIAGILLSVHYCEELHLGQVNYLILFLYILALYFYQKGQDKYMALLLAISIFIKPFTLIFLPFLIVKKQYKALGQFALFSLILFALPFLFYRSIDLTLQQYQYWLQELQIELSHKQSLLADGNHTIFSVVARYTPLRYVLVNSTATLIYQASLLALIGLLFLSLIIRNAKASHLAQAKYNYLMEFSVLIALIPLLAFTSANAFIFSMPVMLLVLVHYKQLRTYEKVIAVAALLFVGGNQHELTGPVLGKFMNDASLVSVGTMFLIYLIFALCFRQAVKISAEA